MMHNKASRAQNNSPLVSLTMITWNRRGDVWESLEQIKKITYPNLEMIVVDNGSTDGVTEMIEKDFPWVRLIKLPRNTRLLARNISFKNAEGEYIVTLDDDSYPEPEAITKMVERFENDSCLGIIAFQIPCGDYFSTEYWSECAAGFIQLYMGSGAGIKKEVFEEIGYYDETLDGYAEEFDFSNRALIAGYTLGHFKDIVAHHRPRFHPNRMRRFFFQNERNQQYLMGKFIRPSYWLLLYLRSTFYRLLRAYYIGGGKALLWAILGNTWGIYYIFKGHKRRVHTPSIIEYHIIRDRNYTTPVSWFFGRNGTRTREIMKTVTKFTNHQFCPRIINEEEIEMKLRLVPLPSIVKKYIEKLTKVNVVRLRKNSIKKQKIFDYAFNEFQLIKEVAELEYQKYRTELYRVNKGWFIRDIKLYRKLTASHL